MKTIRATAVCIERNEQRSHYGENVGHEVEILQWPSHKDICQFVGSFIEERRLGTRRSFCTLLLFRI